MNTPLLVLALTQTRQVCQATQLFPVERQVSRPACVRCEVVGSQWLRAAGETGAGVCDEGSYLAHEGAAVGRAVHRSLGVPHRLPVPLRLRHLVQLLRSTTGFVNAQAANCSRVLYTVSWICISDWLLPISQAVKRQYWPVPNAHVADRRCRPWLCGMIEAGGLQICALC